MSRIPDKRQFVTCCVQTAMSHRPSIVTVSSTTSSVISDYEFREGCKQVLCTSGLSTERGRLQKTCQLTWFPLLPAIALAVYSSYYLVRDVTEYTEKVGRLHDWKDIEAAGSCLESVRRVQTLRYTSTLYLGSGSRVQGFELFVEGAFLATAEALSEASAANERSGRPCDFEHVVQEYFSEINFGQTDIYIDDETMKNFCTLDDFILESLEQMRNLTVTFQNEAVRRVSSTFSLLIDLMLVDCMKNVAYYGSRLHITQSVDRYHALVDMEKTYSRMLTIGAVYFSRGHLEQSERRAMLANLRLADDYASFNQLNVDGCELQLVCKLKYRGVLGEACAWVPFGGEKNYTNYNVKNYTKFEHF